VIIGQQQARADQKARSPFAPIADEGRRIDAADRARGHEAAFEIIDLDEIIRADQRFIGVEIDARAGAHAMHDLVDHTGGIRRRMRGGLSRSDLVAQFGVVELRFDNHFRAPNKISART
jgi:hypothetical protein